jgi:hypothetical protein
MGSWCEREAVKVLHHCQRYYYHPAVRQWETKTDRFVRLSNEWRTSRISQILAEWMNRTIAMT